MIQSFWTINKKSSPRRAARLWLSKHRKLSDFLTGAHAMRYDPKRSFHWVFEKISALDHKSCRVLSLASTLTVKLLHVILHKVEFFKVYLTSDLRPKFIKSILFRKPLWSLKNHLYYLIFFENKDNFFSSMTQSLTME